MPQTPYIRLRNLLSCTTPTLIILALLTVAQSIMGATITWSGGGADSNWSTGANWAGTAPTSADLVVFSGNTKLTNTNDFATNSTFTGITFNSGAGAFVLNGNAITLGGNVTNSSTSLQTINLALAMSAARTFTTTAGGGDIIVNGVISGATFGTTIAGPGTTTFTAANTYTGTTVISSGTLQLDYSAAGAPASNILSTSAVMQLNGGTLSIKGVSGGTSSQTFNGTTFNTNKANAFRITQNGATAVNIALGGITRNAGSTVDFTLPTAGSITTTSTSTTASTGTNKVLTSSAGVACATVDGTTWATNSASGVIGALSTYQTDLFAASLDTDVTTADSPSAFTINTLRFNTANGSVTLNSSGASTVTAGGILVTAAGAGSSISGGVGASLKSGAGKEIVINNQSTSFTVGAVIADNSTPSALTITGNGTTILNGANTYTGATYLTGGGTEILGNKSAFGTGTVTWVANGTATTGTGSSNTIQASTDLRAYPVKECSQ